MFRDRTSPSRRIHDTENGESVAQFGHGRGVAAIISSKDHSTFNRKTASPDFFQLSIFPGISTARKIFQFDGSGWRDMISTDPTEPKHLAVCCRHAAMVVELRALTLHLRLKAGFRPEQPRIPAGNPDGGQ